MTPAQEKHLLRVACACDRIELTMAFRGGGNSSLTAGLPLGAAGGVVLDAVGSLLPARWRWLALVWRIWRRMRPSQ